jgi:peptidoglycan hydrolase-like protein with peptidoglycan-binding domain
MLYIGEDSLELKNEFSNIHFTKGLINLQTDTGKSWDDTIAQFQSYLNEYNNLNDHFDEVFFVSNKLAGTTDAAFQSFNGELRDLMKQRYHW